VNKNKKYVSYLLIYCCVISVPFIWFPALTESVALADGEIHIEETCIQTPESEKILTIIDSIFYCIIPFLITLLFSALTVKKMIQVKKSNNINKRNIKAKPLKETEELMSKSQNKDRIELIKFNRSVSLSCLEPEFLLFRYMASRRSLPIFIDDTIFQERNFLTKKKIDKLQIVPTFSNRKKLHSFKISFLLMIFPLCFLVTNLPIILIIAFKMFNSFLKLERNLLVEFTIAKSLMYLNNSINILLLLAFSKRFRNNFLKTIFTVKL